MSNSSVDNRNNINVLDEENLYQMNRVIRHRLRNHSAGMKMTIEKIRDVLQDVNSSMSDRCHLMLKELVGLEDFTSRMDLLFADVPDAEEIGLFALVRDSRAFFIKKFPMTDLSVDGDEVNASFENGNLIKIVLQEVLLNAGENCDLDGGVVLSWAKSADGFTITVENQVDEEFPDDIPLAPSKPFYTYKGRHDGLGLAIIERLLGVIGGSFSLTSTGKNSILAKLQLPLKELK